MAKPSSQVFSQELKKVLEEAQRDEARLSSLEQEMEKKEQHLVHALADSAQLRAQLCALENISGQHHGSEVEILQEDLVKALERATSSEAEVERYNKEIRKLRERLKSMEDEASRLDSELKSSVAFLQKEKDGVAEENRVLLEQLARKDEEVLSQTQEINNLKSVLACMRVSQLELERLKTKLQDNTKQQLEYSKHEMKGNEMLQSQMGLGYQSSKVSVPKTLSVAEGQEMPSGPVFSQLLDLLQKLNACLQKNELYLDPSRVKVQENEELSDARPNIPQKEAMGLDAAHRNKQINRAGQVSSLQQSVNNGCCKTLDTFPTANAIGKLNKLSIVTCWKWRWAAAASEVQALSRELNTLRSLSKEFLDKTISFPPSSFTSGHEKFRSSMLKAGFQSTEYQCVKEPQVPLTFDKVFTLLASIWQTSSQSAHLEKEIILKSRQLDHLLHVMTRWMQRASRKRQLEKAIVHWLLYVLQSWRDKFHTLDPVLTIAPKPDTRPAATKMSVSPNPKQGGSHGHPKRVVQNALHVRGSSDRKPRAVENCSSLIRKGFRKPEKDAHTFREKPLQILQESLHHKLEALEALIIKEAKAWQHQQQFGDNYSCVDKPTGEFVNPSSTSASLVWRICGELEHCFIEACNQIMVFFGVVNKVPCFMHFQSENMNPKKCVTALLPKISEWTNNK